MSTLKMLPLDMSWFLLESKVVPVHGAFLYVFSPPAGAAADYPRRQLANMKRRTVGAPFNLRPHWQPGALPRWQTVEVDLDRHVSSVQLPAPGDDSQLLALAAELAAPPLAWDRPLWRCHWIEGLSGGRFALLLVLHHAQWDGISVFRLMGEMMAESAQSKRFRAPWQGVSTWLKLTEAAAARRPLAAPRSRRAQAKGGIDQIVATASGLGRVLARQGWQGLTGKRPLALPLAAPESRPERNGDSARSYGLARFPVAQVKALAKASGSSFNDVMTTVVDTAYSRYLDEIGLPADKPLVALVPMAIKLPGAGNQLSGAVVPLGSPTSTAPQRLAEVHAAMSAAKADLGLMNSAGAKLYAMLAMGVAALPDLLRLGERLPVTANMMISNPFGLPKPLYLNGSRLDYFVPLMGPSLGTRLMFGIYTYGEDTYVSMTSLRSVVPDMTRLTALSELAFAELAEALLPQTSSAKAVRKATAKPRAKTQAKAAIEATRKASAQAPTQAPRKPDSDSGRGRKTRTTRR